jgi:hypothetical protein
MAAAAFTQTVVLKGMNDGRTIHLGMTVSDVVNEFAISPDGNGFIQLPSDQNYWLTDLIVVVGGTDTNFQEVFANGQNTGLKISNKSNLNTSNNRQFQTAPIPFKAGSLVRLKQVA